MTARSTMALRVMMLVVIAVVALANAIGWVDPDLWIPFVCIIAVMGVGTRGGVLDSMRFVLLEAGVVLLLGVATFSGSRDFVWAASVAVSVLAVGKIALLEMHRADSTGGRAPRRASGRTSGAPTPRPGPQATDDAASALPHETTEDSEPAQPLGTVAAGELDRGRSEPASAAAAAAAGVGRSVDEDAGVAAASAPAPRKRRERDDPTPVHRIAGPGVGR